MDNCEQVRRTATEMIEQARKIGAQGDTIDPSWVEGWAQVILDCLPTVGKRKHNQKKKGQDE